jgi:GxxExxY protein
MLELLDEDLWLRTAIRWRDPMKEEFSPLSHQVLGCAIEVHHLLGPGLLESVYKQCFARELELRHIRFECERDVPVAYKGLFFESGFRTDFLVEDRLVVELKCVKTLLDVHRAQVLTYLKLLGAPEGLLLNFWVPRLKDDGIRRVVLTH